MSDQSITDPFISITQVAPGTCRLMLQGEIDYYAAPILTQRFHELVDDEHVNCIISLERVSYIDTSGLGFLLSVLQNCKQRGGRVVLLSTQPTINRLMFRTNLDRVFELVESEAEALSRLSV